MKIRKKTKKKKLRKNFSIVEKIFGPKKFAGLSDASIKVEDGRIYISGGFGDIPEVFKELNEILSKDENEIKIEFQPNSSTKKYRLNKLELKLTEGQQKLKRSIDEDKLKRRMMGSGRIIRP